MLGLLFYKIHMRMQGFMYDLGNIIKMARVHALLCGVELNVTRRSKSLRSKADTNMSI